jgi:GGDEF domain-containing protein
MARLGGAEFVILIEDVKDKKYLSALAERLQKHHIQREIQWHTIRSIR